MNVHDVLRRPIISEKNTLLGAQNKFTFEVARHATKPMIEQAVEAIFKVNVSAVNIVHVPGKRRRMGRQRRPTITTAWKKAVVTVQPGQRIEFFEGV
jgi:large subunit ribosomal protein L23